MWSSARGLVRAEFTVDAPLPPGYRAVYGDLYARWLPMDRIGNASRRTTPSREVRVVCLVVGASNQHVNVPARPAIGDGIGA